MTERRYSPDEVSAIFAKAAEAEQSGRLPALRGEGMTLAELQAIGGEVGIPAELVAHAARSVGRAGRPAGRSFLGLPFRVGLNVTLDRPMTDAEWERLVVDLRETFDARGVVRRDGTLRQWTNGNLQALVEPAEGGHRVRLRTTNGTVRTYVASGLAMMIAGSLSLFGAIAGGAQADPRRLITVALVTAAGAVLMGIGALRLPGWARLRRRQMEEVAERLVLRIPADPAP